jgi:hypothetical protein
MGWGSGEVKWERKKEVKEKISKRSVRRRKRLCSISIYTVRVTNPTYPTYSLK